jgi:hypothetical protein
MITVSHMVGEPLQADIFLDKTQKVFTYCKQVTHFNFNLLADLSLTTLVGPEGGFACDDSPLKKLVASGTSLAEDNSLLNMSANPGIISRTYNFYKNFHVLSC